MEDIDKFTTVGNMKAYAGLHKSGTVYEPPTGWNTYTFNDPYPVAPVVVAQGMSTGVFIEVKNVNENGFDYRVMKDGTDGSGESFYWMSYIEDVSSNVLVDQINSILGTEYTTMDEVTATPEAVAKVSENKQAMDIVFYYGSSISDIVASNEKMDAVLASDTAWNNLDSYATLKASMNATEAGKYKIVFRRYSGSRDTTNVVDFDSMFDRDESVSMCENDTFAVLLYTDYITQFVKSDKALNSAMKAKATKNQMNERYTTMKSLYRQSLIDTLKASSLFTLYQIDAPNIYYQTSWDAVFSEKFPRGKFAGHFGGEDEDISNPVLGNCIVFGSWVDGEGLIVKAYIYGGKYSEDGSDGTFTLEAATDIRNWGPISAVAKISGGENPSGLGVMVFVAK